MLVCVFILISFLSLLNAQITLVRPDGTTMVPTTPVRMDQFSYMIIDSCNFANTTCANSKYNTFYVWSYQPNRIPDCASYDCNKFIAKVQVNSDDFEKCTTYNHYQTETMCKYYFTEYDEAGRVNISSLKFTYTYVVSGELSGVFIYYIIVMCFTALFNIFHLFDIITDRYISFNEQAYYTKYHIGLFLAFVWSNVMLLAVLKVFMVLYAIANDPAGGAVLVFPILLPLFQWCVVDMIKYHLSEKYGVHIQETYYDD